MSYRLNPENALIDEMRTAAYEQIDGALASLEATETELEESVHDVRKRMKKLRGLLRLARPALGRTYETENRAFRDIARLFSDIRDAQVLRETVDGLAGHMPEDRAEAVLAPVRDWADARRDAVLREKNLPVRLEDAGHRLVAARDRVTAWALMEAEDAAIAGGVAKTYGRVCKRHFEARQAPNPERLHEWRKRVKYHWYHCRLLRNAWPAELSARADALDDLGEWLGDDHDLVVLVDTLREDATGRLPQAAIEEIATLARERGQMLRQRAFAAAPRLMVESRQALAQRLAGYWSVARASAE
ncbi:CHAD domain-containing protein [Roseovarius salinarum]|uniref:CHAD domain-containing protein n=1 Tax=Roseovarius salinarum TaxID=1981892 RepID=UPI0012FFE806|nr:CHAD domain-containing protein [Roseovarius salinarum]